MLGHLVSCMVIVPHRSQSAFLHIHQRPIDPESPNVAIETAKNKGRDVVDARKEESRRVATKRLRDVCQGVPPSAAHIEPVQIQGRIPERSDFGS